MQLLGDDLNAMQALEDSVHGITEHIDTWDEGRNRQRIAELATRLDEARRGESRTLAELRSIRESENHSHPARFGTYAGTTQAIAKHLKDEEEGYSWLSVEPEEQVEPPLSSAEAVEFLGLLRAIDKKVSRSTGKIRLTPTGLFTQVTL